MGVDPAKGKGNYIQIIDKNVEIRGKYGEINYQFSARSEVERQMPGREEAP
jgi:hypothetical protein